MSKETAVEIKTRWSGIVLFSCELTGELASASYGLRLGFAVRKALEANVNLAGADLMDVDFRGSGLAGSNFTRVDFADADLAYANFERLNLAGADFTRAYCAGANFRSAYCAGTNFARAELAHADFAGAHCSGADFTRAYFTSTDVTGTNLAGADFAGANLEDANLSSIKRDFLAEVLRLPNELDALAGTLLAGGIAHYNGTEVKIGASPCEIFFLAIRPGDTPDNNVVARIALDWTREAMAIRDMIRQTAIVPVDHAP